ncbi:uncharacterized protein LOC141617270 [Silene latifolia]|uniref:uncharacterized protein LOC141617270 n=1 Tax=Silene latifolia TaxID=37657 RepID=UPI003D780A39
MSLSSFFSSGYHRLASQFHTLRYTGMWTVMLVLVAGVASIVPELAFLHSSQKCGVDGYVKIPMELPGMRVCLPAQMVKESPLDVLVPALFASLAVACSAYVLSNIGLM